MHGTAPSSKFLDVYYHMTKTAGQLPDDVRWYRMKRCSKNISSSNRFTPFYSLLCFIDLGLFLYLSSKVYSNVLDMYTSTVKCMYYHMVTHLVPPVHGHWADVVVSCNQWGPVEKCQTPDHWIMSSSLTAAKVFTSLGKIISLHCLVNLSDIK